MDLVIDDERDIKADLVCRTYESGIAALRANKIDTLYLDHDLGQKHGKDGYGIACFLERNAEHRPRIIIIVSQNPVGVQKIQSAIEPFYFMVGNRKWMRNK